MILIEPMRTPPSVASFMRSLGSKDDMIDTMPTSGYWTEYTDIDMHGKGDKELIHNWKSKHTIEDLKRMVEAKNYSAITVSAGNPSFPFAALKSFSY